MQLTSIITAAGLAASTNAILLPPDVSASDNDIISTLPVPVEVDINLPKAAETQNLKLKCPGCPVRIPHHGEAKIVNDIPSHLELDFTIEPSDGVDRLLVNNFELYPNADPFRNSLVAAVRPDVVSRKQSKRPTHFKGPQPQNIHSLGFGMQTTPVAKSEEDSLELVMVELDIIEVGDIFIDGIPNVQVKLVKTPSGKLMMGEVETIESSMRNPMDKQEECATLICKWKAVIMQKLASLRLHKGCGGRPAHVKGTHDHVKGQGHHGRPHHASDDGEHRGQRPGSHQKNWGLLFKNIASHILLPVAVGILAGVAASILGMMVGTLVVFLWRLAFRRGGSRRSHRHGRHHKASHQEAVVEDEKSGLMTGEEDVEAPPAYLEEGVIVLDDKKSENVA
ncbi:hypothetical protein F4821DRAFT_152751 [Hypoxylon rubiginosum]|uniref:Uncharacterized protein n=1 Tax=Hypoxylon rubiginosum TaxID=110542 RepID=A0ACC0CXV5_9PEZI|nr:hypothetical protein F4821DRAFT_152751 [Hypoxylon rubiginosum]